MSSFPPLDLQTEHLEQNQYPSLRLLLLIAVIMGAGMVLSWAAQSRGYSPAQLVVAQHEVRGHSVDRQMFSRVIPLRP